MATYTRTMVLSGSIGGRNFRGTVSRTGSTEETVENASAMAAGSVGQLTTRTDNDTGVITLVTGHGQTDGTFDVYWATGIRRGMTTTISVNAMSVDGGTGDNLPTNLTAVVIDKQEIINLDTTAATIVMAMVQQDRRASVQFQEEAGTPIVSLDLGRNGDGEGYGWAEDIGATPFTANIGKVAVSNGSSDGTNTVRVGLLSD